jgi:hypothetical protein
VYASLDFLPKWDAYGYSFLRGLPVSGYAFIDPLFLGIPLVGFALMWVAISWYKHTFDDEQILSIPFALGFVILSYASYYVADVIYFWNNAFLVATSRGESSPFWASLSAAMDFVTQNFLDHLLQSPFFVLVLSALLGWASYYLVHKVFSHSHHAPTNA